MALKPEGFGKATRPRGLWGTHLAGCGRRPAVGSVRGLSSLAMRRAADRPPCLKPSVAGRGLRSAAPPHHRPADSGSASGGTNRCVRRPVWQGRAAPRPGTAPTQQRHSDGSPPQTAGRAILWLDCIVPLRWHPAARHPARQPRRPRPTAPHALRPARAIAPKCPPASAPCPSGDTPPAAPFPETPAA